MLLAIQIKSWCRALANLGRWCPEERECSLVMGQREQERSIASPEAAGFQGAGTPTVVSPGETGGQGPRAANALVSMKSSWGQGESEVSPVMGVSGELGGSPDLTMQRSFVAVVSRELRPKGAGDTRRRC